MKKLWLIITSLIVLMGSYSQNNINNILEEIESNNTTLLALQKKIEVQKLGNKTGIYLPNPEIEFGYLWGNPSEIGNENSFAITQSMDFPTAYGLKNRISNLENQNLDILYNSERIKVVLEAKQLIVNLSYYNAVSSNYAHRVRIAEEIASSYQKMFNQGEINANERNQVYLDLISCINEKRIIDIERKSLLNRLITLNGGKEIQYEATEILLSPLPLNFNKWYADIKNNSPSLQHLTQQIEISRQQVKLNKALSLPKLSAGYSDERILGEKLQGITVGISIPLWENKNSVKQAKADVLSNEYSLEDNKLRFYNRLQSLFEKASSLLDTALKYRQALASYSNELMLRKALEAGEIPLLDYLYQIEAYYDAYNKMLEVERDYSLAEAELTALSL